jgi:hypothetical protein
MLLASPPLFLLLPSLKFAPMEARLHLYTQGEARLVRWGEGAKPEELASAMKENLLRTVSSEVTENLIRSDAPAAHDVLEITSFIGCLVEKEKVLPRGLFV